MRIRGTLFFFFSSRRRHTRLQGDWSSDVCSSDLQRAREAHLALALEEVVAEHLHVGCARAQADKAQAQHGHDHLAAPQGSLGRQQGTGGIEHAARHGATPVRASSLTYWAMAGVAGFICRRSRAMTSMRCGVAWARFSTCRDRKSTRLNSSHLVISYA